MIENRYNPTFANILSSLKVKGATLDGGAGKEGQVPVLNENGVLNLSVIPINSIETSITINPLAKVAFVNINDVRTEISRDGSIVAPYKKLSDAAASFNNFLIVPGEYNTDRVEIRNVHDRTVNIFGLGKTLYSGLTFSGYEDGTVFRLYNISAATLTFDRPLDCTLILDGTSSVNQVVMHNEAALSVYIGAQSSVGTYNGSISSVSYLASSGRIANESQNVAGETVANAIDSLSTRKIKIPKFTADSLGIHADSPDYEDISVPASGDTYSIVTIGTTLVSAINNTFHKNGDSPTYNTVTAGDITATSLKSNTVTTQVLNFGSGNSINAKLTVDSGKFLVVAD